MPSLYLCIKETMRWDKKANTYAESSEKVHYYQSDRGSLVFHQTFKRDKKTKEWEIVRDFDEEFREQTTLCQHTNCLTLV